MSVIVLTSQSYHEHVIKFEAVNQVQCLCLIILVTLCNSSIWNSVISTPNAKYMCINIKYMYLATPMDRYEYMRMLLDFIPQ